MTSVVAVDDVLFLLSWSRELCLILDYSGASLGFLGVSGVRLILMRAVHVWISTRQPRGGGAPYRQTTKPMRVLWVAGDHRDIVFFQRNNFCVHQL